MLERKHLPETSHPELVSASVFVSEGCSIELTSKVVTDPEINLDDRIHLTFLLYFFNR